MLLLLEFRLRPAAGKLKLGLQQNSNKVDPPFVSCLK